MITRTVARQRNRRGEGERLREEIVDAAVALLEEGSEEAVTLRAVARRVGIAAPSIYAHFEDRAAVIDAVREAGFVNLTNFVLAAMAPVPLDQPVERLVVGCRAYLDFAGHHPQQYWFMFGPAGRVEKAPTDPPPAGLVTGLASFQVLVDALEDAVVKGRSTSHDVFADAVSIWVALHGLATLRSSMSRFPWRDLDVQVREYVRLLGRLVD